MNAFKEKEGRDLEESCAEPSCYQTYVLNRTKAEEYNQRDVRGK